MIDITTIAGRRRRPRPRRRRAGGVRPRGAAGRVGRRRARAPEEGLRPRPRSSRSCGRRPTGSTRRARSWPRAAAGATGSTSTPAPSAGSRPRSWPTRCAARPTSMLAVDEGPALPATGLPHHLARPGRRAGGSGCAAGAATTSVDDRPVPRRPPAGGRAGRGRPLPRRRGGAPRRRRHRRAPRRRGRRHPSGRGARRRAGGVGGRAVGRPARVVPRGAGRPPLADLGPFVLPGPARRRRGAGRRGRAAPSPARCRRAATWSTSTAASACSPARSPPTGRSRSSRLGVLGGRRPGEPGRRSDARVVRADVDHWGAGPRRRGRRRPAPHRARRQGGGQGRGHPRRPGRAGQLRPGRPRPRRQAPRRGRATTCVAASWSTCSRTPPTSRSCPGSTAADVPHAAEPRTVSSRSGPGSEPRAAMAVSEDLTPVQRRRPRRRHQPLPPGRAGRGLPPSRRRGVRAGQAAAGRRRAGRGDRAGGLPPHLEPAREVRPGAGHACARTCSPSATAGRSTCCGRRRPVACARSATLAARPRRATTSSTRWSTSRWPSGSRTPSHQLPDGRAGGDRPGLLRGAHLP